jgi:hypothetical protein
LLWRWRRPEQVNAQASEPIAEQRERQEDPLTKQRKQIREDAKETGAFRSINELLEDSQARLEELKRMRWPSSGHFKDISAYCRNVGTFVVGPEFGVYEDRLMSRHRPYILIASLPKAEGDDNVLMDYVYLRQLTKHERASIGVFRDIVYEMGFGLPKDDKYPGGWFWACYVKVSDDGRASMMHGEMRRTVRVGSGRSLTSYVSFYYGEMSIGRREEGKGSWLETFYCVMNYAVMRDNHWSVTVSDNENKVCYSVPQNDGPRMFRARDKNGKRIFHAVAGHIRKDGATVKPHYRGNRKFTMDGLDMTVQIPGLHRRSLIFMPAFVEPGQNAPTVDVSEASKTIGVAMRR